MESNAALITAALHDTQIQGPIQPHTSAAYITTDTGNRVSRDASILGSQHIVLAGRCLLLPGCVLAADRPKVPSKSSLMIALGRGCVVGERARLEPSPAPASASKREAQQYYYPIKVGDWTRVGSDARVSSVSIGNCCDIGAGAVLVSSVVCGVRLGMLNASTTHAGPVHYPPRMRLRPSGISAAPAHGGAPVLGGGGSACSCCGHPAPNVFSGATRGCPGILR
jgi:carbonic anhydrase/acetyltransferase-like protein (isoleucine patch superfamily)